MEEGRKKRRKMTPSRAALPHHTSVLRVLLLNSMFGSRKAIHFQILVDQNEKGFPLICGATFQFCPAVANRWPQITYVEMLRRCSGEGQNGGGLSVKLFDFGLSEEGMFRPSACSPPDPESCHCCRLELNFLSSTSPLPRIIFRPRGRGHLTDCFHEWVKIYCKKVTFWDWRDG